MAQTPREVEADVVQLLRSTASPAMKTVVDMADKLAQSPGTAVLICGETGTGKDLLARYIHHVTPRSRPQEFLKVTCGTLLGPATASLSPGLSVSSPWPGFSGLVPGTTLCLDEPGDLEDNLQAQILGTWELGPEGSKPPDADPHVRVVSLTSGLLDERLRLGGFRADLYHRLNAFRIEIPPLRSRPEDILPLARTFLAEASARLGKKIVGIRRSAQNTLLSYSYPGNVRELRNIVERAVILETSTELSVDASIQCAGLTPNAATVPFFQVQCAPGDVPPGLREVERAYVLRVLELSGGNKSQAARVLGVAFPTISKKLAEGARSS